MSGTIPVVSREESLQWHSCHYSPRSCMMKPRLALIKSSEENTHFVKSQTRTKTTVLDIRLYQWVLLGEMNSLLRVSRSDRRLGTTFSHRCQWKSNPLSLGTEFMLLDCNYETWFKLTGSSGCSMKIHPECVQHLLVPGQIKKRGRKRIAFCRLAFMLC